MVIIIFAITHQSTTLIVKETGGAREVTVLKMEIQEIMKVVNHGILPYI